MYEKNIPPHHCNKYKISLQPFLSPSHTELLPARVNHLRLKQDIIGSGAKETTLK